jgi:hypothetical protein
LTACYLHLGPREHKPSPGRGTIASK